jgi:hypothetical protein
MTALTNTLKQEKSNLCYLKTDSRKGSSGKQKGEKTSLKGMWERC